MDQGPVYSGGEPIICRFTEKEWWSLLSLAHECGFDAAKEYVSAVYPTNTEGDKELDPKAASGLYIGVGVILNQDTLPFATTWESDDGRLHFRWAVTPGYALDHKPEDVQNSGNRSDFALNKRELQRFSDYLGKGRVLVARTESRDVSR